jgi:hypothetical protein
VSTTSEALRLLVPPIRRARGYRLYDERGRRYVDLNLCGARALLGHRHERLNRALKNLLSRGQVFPMPSRHTQRFQRAVAARYPGFPYVRTLGNEADVKALIARYLNCEIEAIRIADPAVGGSGSVVVDRPFLPAEVRQRALAEAEAVLVNPPFQLCGCPCPVVFKRDPEAQEPDAGWQSPLLVAGALRSLHDLDRHRLPEWYRDDLLDRCTGWRQCGIYFSPASDRSAYAEVFRRFLDRGYLLSTDPGVPSVLPAELSPGELAGLMRLLEET